jgi:hypothetical protein
VDEVLLNAGRKTYLGVTAGQVFFALVSPKVVWGSLGGLARDALRRYTRLEKSGCSDPTVFGGSANPSLLRIFSFCGAIHQPQLQPNIKKNR